ncbi:RloB family protein [Microbispora bryophytorum]|uniref:RloB domain-containing protein n=1 Tax=Microbispora bryophytorum subsp. camponoti TaxID=1677852 RepID=A0ABR8L7R9_9ACTN|nr:RloB family protein [Microbispora camponoti]MBD3146961.1 RloB domain-containing protein [Microbispora camponoti]
MSRRTEGGKEQSVRRRRGRLDDERPLTRRPESRRREVRVLYVACEGESTEPDYLQYLNEQFGDGDGRERQPFRIQPVYRKNGMTPSQVVEAARAAAAEDEAWAVFDRDRWDDIPQAVKMAAESQIELAFSHPSFDLWLLLHFQAFSGAQSGSSKNVVDKLRQTADAFRDYDKRGDKSIKGPRRDALKGLEHKAVARARSLIASCPQGECAPARAEPDRAGRDAQPLPSNRWAARSGHAPDCPILRRDPSTDVWRLLVALGIV